MLKKILKNKTFIKSIGTLSIGSLLASGITILISPILTRIFTPTEIGLYTLVLTAVSLFGSILCARYDVAIVIEKDHNKVLAIIKLSLIISLFMSLTISVGYAIYFLFKDLNLFQLIVFPITLFLILVSTALLKILDAYNNKTKEYKLMSTMGVVRSGAFGFFSIIFGVIKFSSFGLLISQAISNTIGVKRQSKALMPYLSEIKSIDNRQMKLVARDYKNQPKYSAPAIFANNFSYSSINLFIEALFGTAILGLYSMSYKILGLPLTIVSRNINRVFLQEASEEINKYGRFSHTFSKMSLLLFVLAVPLFIVMYFLLPVLTPLIFGSGWESTGLIIKVLSPMFAIRFVVNSVSSGFQIIGKQKTDLYLMILFSLASIAIFTFVKTLSYSLILYLIIVSITYSIIYVIYYIILFFNSIKKQNL